MTQPFPDRNRLFWHSRRGMRELDVLLVPFLDEKYVKLEEEDQARYRALLDCEDQDLFAWFMSREKAHNEDLQRIVELILEHARSRAG